MERLEAISVDLTMEEMTVLLEQLGSDSYAGLDNSELDELSARERTLVLDVARRGLIARRILTQNEAGEWQVGQYALAALGVSLAPTRSVMVIQGHSRDAALTYLFHTAQDVFVTHEIVENGTHQFLIVRDRETWQNAILSTAGLDQVGGQGETPERSLAVMPAPALNEAYEQAQSGSPDEAEAKLIQHGVDRDTANRLATTLTGPVTFATVIAISHAPEEGRDDVTMLSSAHGIWSLEMMNGQGEESRMRMTEVKGEDARRRLIELIS